jgi:excinuclease ABC subunit C
MALDFERAALLRDRIRAIEYATNFQYRIAAIGADQDVIGLAQETEGLQDVALIQLFVIRSGNLIGSESFPLVNVEDETMPTMVASFLTQFYEEASEIPPEIVLPCEVTDTEVIEAWLSEKRRTKVTLKVPQRGEKRALVRQASETAAEQLTIFQARQAKDTVKQETALRELQEALQLTNPPNRIECYDISTLQGTSTVASRVVFVQGTPQKSEYRRFNIRTIAHEGSDDYQSMREALTRRFRRYIESLEQTESPAPGKVDKDETWRLLPDLLLIDGGKGQLGVAVEVLQEFELFEHVPVAGLAKRFEELYLPARADPLALPRKSEGLYLLQRIRDEAHRFAITTHRAQRQRKGIVSRLEAVPGIGPARRKALLRAFGNDIDAIRTASLEELMAVPGITQEVAEQLKVSLD